MKKALNSILNNEFLDSSTLFSMSKLGLILKITYSQYIITEKGFKLLTEN